MSYVICFYALYTLFPCNVKASKFELSICTLFQYAFRMTLSPAPAGTPW